MLRRGAQKQARERSGDRNSRPLHLRGCDRCVLFCRQYETKKAGCIAVVRLVCAVVVAIGMALMLMLLLSTLVTTMMSLMMIGGAGGSSLSHDKDVAAQLLVHRVGCLLHNQ